MRKLSASTLAVAYDRRASDSSSSNTRVCAMYSFTAPDDTPGYLPLAIGDLVEVLDKDPSGWWEGVHVLSGVRGVFPANYVREINDIEEDESSMSAGNGGRKSSVVVELIEEKPEKIVKVDKKKEPLVVTPQGNAKVKNECDTRYGFYAKNWSRLNSISLVFVAIVALFTVNQAQMMELEVFTMFDVVVYIYAILF
jgi:hypothetical protein